MNESTLHALVESSNADIRLMLGQLQMIRLRKRSLTYDEAKVSPALIEHDTLPCKPSEHLTDACHLLKWKHIATSRFN